jgi:menaquinone-dependent protoporphyrinogen oxidase
MDRIAASGHSVELLPASDGEGLDTGRFQGAILAGSLHAGGFQKSLIAFVRERAAALNQMPTLFLAVSLSAAGADAEDWAGLTQCVIKFESETGWQPTETLHVAGAFRFTEYDFFRAWAMRRIADQKGEVVDPNADKEYTDWAKLGADVDAWLTTLASD